MLERFSADIRLLQDRIVKMPARNIWMRLTSLRTFALLPKSASQPPLTTSIDIMAACHAAVRLPPCPAAHGRLTGRRICAIIKSIQVRKGGDFMDSICLRCGVQMIECPVEVVPAHFGSGGYSRINIIAPSGRSVVPVTLVCPCCGEVRLFVKLKKNHD